MKRNKIKPLSQPEETGRYSRQRDDSLDRLIDTLLSEDIGNRARISLFRGVLFKLLPEYVSVAEMTPKRRSQDILSSFRHQPSEMQVESNGDLTQHVSEILSLIKNDNRE